MVRLRVGLQTGSDASSGYWLRSWPRLLTTIWMTCSGSIPSTGKPLTSTTLSPAWSSPTHTHTHIRTDARTNIQGSTYRHKHSLIHMNTHTHTEWLGYAIQSAFCHSLRVSPSPLRSASPPWMMRAMKISPLTSFLLMVAPCNTAGGQQEGARFR